MRRMCRRSELRAARWLEGRAVQLSFGFPNTNVMHLDDSKAVSADGSSVRVWSHATGRRIATLPGHSGKAGRARVTSRLRQHWPGAVWNWPLSEGADWGSCIAMC